jgi:DNA-directed RNA polymerase specialized sigma24 family protein
MVEHADPGSPESYRDYLRLLAQHYFHDRPVAEIADAMGRSPSAVAGLIKRGLRRLRARLKPEDAS